MGCLLRIYGKKTFNLDKFEINSNLKPTTIHRKGEYDLRKRKIEKSQLIYTISNADFSDLKAQIKDTIKFLKKNEKYIEQFCTNKTIDTLALDFSFNSRIDRKTVEVQNDYLPVELIRLAGKLNMSIWLTQWPAEKVKQKK